MIPSGTTQYFRIGNSYVGHDFQPWFIIMNAMVAKVTKPNGTKYSYEDLQEDINGLNNALFGDQKELRTRLKRSFGSNYISCFNWRNDR